MPRLPRVFVPGCSLHIIQRGNNRGTIFLQDADRRLFLAVLGQVSTQSGVAVHAYALMSNHFHLLATPETAASMPKMMQRVGLRYVRYFNRTYGRIGTLWNGRYRGLLIDTARYCLTCLRYIEQNPVR